MTLETLAIVGLILLVFAIFSAAVIWGQVQTARADAIRQDNRPAPRRPEGKDDLRRAA